jgi:hypothetical protein
MIYDGFVVLDTRDSTGTETSFCGPFGANSGLYDKPKPLSFKTFREESGDYTVPAGPVYYGPGGGGPPQLPAYNPPSGGGASNAPSIGGGGGGWQQWVNPETIGATVGVIGSVVGAAKANQSPDKARIKAVCGRKPLFNIKGKKDKYNACVQNLMAPPPVFQQQAPPPAGMSKSTKIIIGVVAFIVLLAIIITIIMVMKKKAVVPATA